MARYRSRGDVSLFFGLLLIFALIAFLISPAVQRHVRTGKASSTDSEVRQFESAAERMLADSGRESLRDLFIPAAFDQVWAWYVLENEVNAFDASVALYSRAMATKMPWAGAMTS